MSDIIQLLPDSVANQIAAGEVIQRPASVIKELVENAVDAEATRIDVAVVDSGRTSIQVIDNGKGMSETDARLSFERHATSKIRQADDLFNLRTMGFRGEALASIAAVAQVELKTRLRGEEVGTHLSIAGGHFGTQEPCATPEGSNFLIENLFYNVPARRKFLKSNATELNNIITAFQRIALVYPDIAFTLRSNGSELFDLRTGSLRQRIVDIFGKRINQDLLPVKVETSLCGIRGFVGKPEAARKKSPHQYFFVNGRYMRHPYFAKAVQSAFERLVPQGEQVPFFIYFDVSPHDIDVNIHPTKTEIKFDNEQAVWQILSAAVKDAVGMFNDVATLDFDSEGKPDIPVFNPESEVAPPKLDINPQYNPFMPSAASSHHAAGGSLGGGAGAVEHVTDFSHRTSVQGDWQQLFPNVPDETETLPGNSLIDEKAPSHYQYKGRYIMTAVKSGLMIVDQHRAHLRILFEQIRKRHEAHKGTSHKVMFPETLSLDAKQQVTLAEVMPELSAMGFELTAMGGASWAVNAIPEGLEGVDVLSLLRDMLDEAGSGPSALKQVADTLALDMAKAAAIPYGQVLSNAEMEDIVNNLFQCENVNYTPEGKRILCIFKQADMEQMLG